MIRRVKYLLPFLSVMVALVMSSVAATPPTDLLYGHYEIHVDYTHTPGDPDAGWSFSISYDEDDDFNNPAGVVRLDPTVTTLVAAPKTRQVVPNPPGIFSRFGPAGTRLWVFPQTQVLGTDYLGVRTTMATGVFQARVGSNYTSTGQGSISLRLISVTGSGPEAGGQVAIWKTETFGSAVFSFDTTDGITAADEIPTIPVTSHTHYNWGFTKPGIYELEVEAVGKLMPAYGSTLTRGRGVIRFSVPFPSRAGGGAEWRLLAGADGSPDLAVAVPAEDVVYPSDRVLLEAMSPGSGGAAWEMELALDASAADFRNGVGLDVGAVNAGLDGGVWTERKIRLDEVRGPGAMSWLEGDGAVLMDSPGDEISYNGPRALKAVFSATGLYRAGLTVSGLRNGEPQARRVEVVFGAGVPVEFGYAAWAASFEATGGLAAGALSDPEADGDGDGVSNGVEFAFFWHGLDPTHPDAGRMPRMIHRTAEEVRFSFLRDTYKDPLDESSWEIRSQVSTNLQSWTTRSSRTPGFPLGIVETGSLDEGNAHGRVMDRHLRVRGEDPGRWFFRFRVDAP